MDGGVAGVREDEVLVEAGPRRPLGEEPVGVVTGRGRRRAAGERRQGKRENQNNEAPAAASAKRMPKPRNHVVTSRRSVTKPIELPTSV